jgi:hypothetical protein
MCSDLAIRLSASELRNTFNSQTMVGITLHVWKYFGNLLFEKAKLIKKTKTAYRLRDCLEQISRHLLLIGDQSKDIVTSMIIIHLKQLAFLSHRHANSMKTVDVLIHNMDIRELGLIEADMLIDFLMDLTLEIIAYIKSDPNKGPLSDCTIDYCWSSIVEVEPKIRNWTNQIIPNKKDYKETYLSCMATMEILHQPIPDQVIKVEKGMDIYRIGQEGINVSPPIVYEL